MRTYDEKFISEVFEVMPWANWISVNDAGICHTYINCPVEGDGIWHERSSCSFLGKVILPEGMKWEYSLRERKSLPIDKTAYAKGWWDAMDACRQRGIPTAPNDEAVKK